MTVAQVLDLAGRVPDRYRALILVTTFGCLRWGEVSALQRQDLDAKAGAVRVRHAFTEKRGAGLVLGSPKVTRRPADSLTAGGSPSGSPFPSQRVR